MVGTHQAVYVPPASRGRHRGQHFISTSSGKVPNHIMKLLSLALLAPLVSAACDTSKNEISLTFMLSNFYDYEVEEFCPVAGSCVNMPAGPDEWSQKVDWALMKANTCVRFYKVNDCPSGVETWEPPCYDVDWAVFVLSDWQDGAIKSYTVFNK